MKDVNENSSMDTLGQWDSLNHMNLMMALEEEFGDLDGQFLLVTEP